MRVIRRPRRLAAALWALLLLLALLPGRALAVQPDDPEALLRQGHFSDVPAHAWYAGAVAWARQAGLLEGTSKSTFSPDEPISRAVFLAALHRLAGSPAACGPGFDDVSPARREAAAVVWARETGVAVGVDPTHLQPDQPLTGEQALLFLWRLAGLPRAETAGTTAAGAGWETVSPWAAEAVLWGTESGLTACLTGPDQPVTRARAAALLFSFAAATS